MVSILLKQLSSTFPLTLFIYILLLNRVFPLLAVDYTFIVEFTSIFANQLVLKNKSSILLNITQNTVDTLWYHWIVVDLPSALELLSVVGEETRNVSRNLELLHYGVITRKQRQASVDNQKGLFHLWCQYTANGWSASRLLQRIVELKAHDLSRIDQLHDIQEYPSTVFWYSSTPTSIMVLHPC